MRLVFCGNGNNMACLNDRVDKKVEGGKNQRMIGSPYLDVLSSLLHCKLLIFNSLHYLVKYSITVF